MEGVMQRPGLAILSVAGLMLGLAFMASTSAVRADGTIPWEGQGVTGGELNSVQCDSENTPYLLWVFTLGGGDNTVTSATLTINGTDVYGPNTPSGGNIKFLTDFYDLDTLTASVSYVGELGSGTANLVISHGCPGEEAAISDIVTEVHDTAHQDVTGTAVPLGSVVHDSATLTWDPTSAEVPAGSSVTFYFFAGAAPNDDGLPCLADPTLADDSENVAVPTTATSPYSIDDALGQGPLTAGDYFYYAVFTSGDTDVITHATSPCEPFSVNQGTSDTATAVHLGDDHTTDYTGASVPLGSTIHDSATVTGDPAAFTPTGNVQFWFFENGTCTGTGIDAGLVALVGGVAHPSNSFGPLEAGDYSFQAEYLGDDNYSGSISPCEPVTVEQGRTTTLTAVHLGDDHTTDIQGTNIPPGSIVHDSATVTGDPAAFTPTGNVQFWFFENGTCTGTGIDAGLVALVGGVAHPSDSFGPLAPGSYSFQAEYLGDDNYAGSLSACEPFSVGNPALTPGYWRNHLAPLGTNLPGISASCKSRDGCSANGPWTIDFLPQSLGSYVVDTAAKAKAVFNAMNCSQTTSAANCLAGHLLAAKLNVANDANPCIQDTIDDADAFLISIGYSGPGTYTLTAAQRAEALDLKSDLDSYNNTSSCS
jgi:hypothetical protein